MNIKYYAADGTVKSLGDDALVHYKYIKKVKTGSGYRYFYTPEEVQAYYEEQKKSANKKYKKDLKKMESEHKMLMKPTPLNSKSEIKRNQGIENHRYAHEKTKVKIEKTVKPIAKTIKAAKEGKIPKKAKLVDDKKKNDRINKGKSAVEKKIKNLKKEIKNEHAGAKRIKKALSNKPDKKGDTVYSYYGNGKYYDKSVVTGTKKMPDGRQISSLKTKKRKQKTSRVERAALKAYRKTHPYE